MNKSLPEFVTAYRDRHGKLRYRFRRTGQKSVYLRNDPGTDEFWQEYLAAKNAAAICVDENSTEPGTFDDLIARYYRSTIWANIPSDTTKMVYRGQIERFRATYGRRRVATMQAVHISNLMASLQATPSAASNLKKRLSQIFDFAIVQGWRRDNPTKAVKSPRSKSKGFHTWQEDEIAAFEAQWPLGTRERLALALLLHTAQRRSDVARMGPQHMKEGRIRVKQMKTGRELEIPMHPRLREAIMASRSGQLAFLVSSRGTPYTKESFGNWFRSACNEAGLKHCSAHGLRKAAARRMAEIGMSNQMIKSITGHTTDSEVSRYTRDAEQVQMADKVMAAIIEDGLSNRQKPGLSNQLEGIENVS